jgi:DNA primase
MSFQNYIENNYTVKKTANTEFIRICCPFCGDTKFHGYISIKKDLYKCWKCAWSHKVDGSATTAYHFLREAENVSHAEAIRILEDDSFIASSKGPIDVKTALDEMLETEVFDVEEQTVTPDLPALRPLNPNDKSIVGKAAWTYWKDRTGTQAEQKVKFYEAGYCTTGRYAGRIIVPIYEKGNLVWFQARAFYPPTMEPKYLQPHGAKKPLFGLDYFEENEEIIICEGLFDAIAIGPGAVCIFGSEIHWKQLDKILDKEPSYITICLDPDKAGWKGSKNLLSKLTNNGIADYGIVLTLPQDPAYYKEQARKVIEQETVEPSFKVEQILGLLINDPDSFIIEDVRDILMED